MNVRPGVRTKKLPIVRPAALLKREKPQMSFHRKAFLVWLTTVSLKSFPTE